jgi:hypothetical protein
MRIEKHERRNVEELYISMSSRQEAARSLTYRNALICGVGQDCRQGEEGGREKHDPRYGVEDAW